MTINEIVSYIPILIACLGVFVEITPIKINPITSLLKYCGSRINEDLRTDIKDMKSNIEKLENKVDANEIDRIRWEILDFSNSCRNKRKHTRDEFLHIIELNQKYHKIINEKGIENGQIDIEYAFIEKLYKNCLENNTFLCANGDDDC